jgi:hypothetical protein
MASEEELCSMDRIRCLVTVRYLALYRAPLDNLTNFLLNIFIIFFCGRCELNFECLRHKIFLQASYVLRF